MNFVAVPSVEPEECERNAALALMRRLPHIERVGDVAVVGGGQSLADCLDDLRDWRGPIWAINQSFMWLKARGVAATFFTADPKDQPWLIPSPGDRALVTIFARPALLDRLSEAHVTTYRLAEDEIHCGPTTATVAPYLAGWLGHRSVTFFGCESSFGVEGSHVYPVDLPADQIAVRCGDRMFSTKPEFLLQAQVLAELCREIPEFHHDRSGGLLGALMANPEHEVVTGPTRAVAV